MPTPMAESGSTGEMNSYEPSLTPFENSCVLNGFKRQFLTFLGSKDDTLLLQTAGSLFTLLTQSSVSQALLFHSNIFPIGHNKKGMLL